MRPGSSVFGAEYWDVKVPRLVEEDEAVRSANMAVHILILAKQPSLMSLNPVKDGEDFYGGALRCYGVALNKVSQAGSSHADLRSAILCSMFFVIFEIINGDQKAAEAHLYSGQKMMDELQQAQPNASPRQRTGTLRSELSHVLQLLALQARRQGVAHWQQEIRKWNCD